MSKIDLSDGVDYIRLCLYSEKDAPLADYEPCDGSIKMNLDEIWNQVKTEEFVNPEGILINKIIDVLGHELSHKWFIWAMSGDEYTETFNEQDERAMRCVSDWVNFGKTTKLGDYDWK